MGKGSNNKRKYYPEIDICRGMGIILVVLGHALKQTGETNQVFKVLLSVIYSFHMPLFFFLSGFVADKLLYFTNWRERGDYIKGRALRLLVPYFAVGILYLPVKYVLSRYAVKPYDFSSMWKLLLGENPDVALWFLYFLFFISLICVLILRKNNLKLVLAISIVCSVLTCASGYSLRILQYGAFFILGIWVKVNYEQILEKWSGGWWKTMGPAAAVIFAAANAALFMWQSQALTALTVVTAFTGILLCMGWSLHISKKESRVRGTFLLLGKYSMDIYILSEPVNTAARLLLWNILKLNYLLCTLLCFAVGMLLPIPVSKYIVRRVPVLRMGILGIKE